MRLTSMVLAVYFGLLSLAPDWQGLEFFKVKALLVHYSEFQNETEDSSFWSFVQEHYIAQSNDNKHEHNQLPFKSTGSTAQITLFMPLSFTSAIVQNLKASNAKQSIHSAPLAVMINDYFECWHPPQLV